ncbi:MAG: hypothetical protein NTW29_21120 [Bacteroidetes bacterium]|nr:hypothetical protein [Bacteroidota bacterium]
MKVLNVITFNGFGGAEKLITYFLPDISRKRNMLCPFCLKNISKYLNSKMFPTYYAHKDNMKLREEGGFLVSNSQTIPIVNEIPRFV